MESAQRYIEVRERDGVRIAECVQPIAEVRESLDLISACLENHVGRLLVDSRLLPEAFFQLRSLFAGELLQKFENYRLRVAAVFAPDADHGERFEQFLAEARGGRSFRAFTDRAEAEAWLASA